MQGSLFQQTLILRQVDNVAHWGDILQLAVLELIRKVCRGAPAEKGRHMKTILALLQSTSTAVVYECAVTLVLLSQARAPPGRQGWQRERKSAGVPLAPLATGAQSLLHARGRWQDVPCMHMLLSGVFAVACDHAFMCIKRACLSKVLS